MNRRRFLLFGLLLPAMPAASAVLQRENFSLAYLANSLRSLRATAARYVGRKKGREDEDLLYVYRGEISLGKEYQPGDLVFCPATAGIDGGSADGALSWSVATGILLLKVRPSGSWDGPAWRKMGEVKNGPAVLKKPYSTLDEDHISWLRQA